MRRATTIMGSFAIAAALLTLAPAAHAGSVAPVANPAKIAGSSAPVEQVRWRGRRVGGAVALTLGILGAAAIIGSARSHARDRGHYRSDHGNDCRRWLYQCEEDGYRKACAKFDRYC